MKNKTISFETNVKALDFACDMFKFMDDTDNFRIAIIRTKNFSEKDQKYIYSLDVEDFEIISGYAYGEKHNGEFLSDGDLVGVQVLEYTEIQLENNYNVAICYIVSLLEPTYDFSGLWKIKQALTSS